MEKPKIILKEEPYRIIKWFTENYENEVAALGIGKKEKGNLIIEKLVFPKQVVSPATVDIEPGDWGELIKEITMEEMKKIVFYWHKHPAGSPHHSSTDEEETYEAIMGTDIKRKFFGFAQTAKSGNSITSEAFIYINAPFKARIDASLVYETDEKIGEYCKKIIKDKIKTYKPKTTIITYPIKKHEPKETVVGNYQYNKDYYNETLYADKNKPNDSDILNSLPNLKHEDIFFFKETSGCFKVFVGKKVNELFKRYIGIIKDKIEMENIQRLIKRIKVKKSTETFSVYLLTPAKKSFKPLKNGLDRFYEEWEQWVKTKYFDELEDNIPENKLYDFEDQLMLENLFNSIQMIDLIPDDVINI